jgi:CRP/FNR family transcriptional regulator, anaerobic regulatory protein
MAALERGARRHRAYSDLGPPCEERALRAIRVFEALTEDEFRRVQHIVRLFACEPGEAIFHETDPAHFLFNVFAGTVRIYKSLPDGRRQIVGFMIAGDFLGLVFNETYTYTAEAVDAVGLCRFKRHDYEALLAEMPHLERQLLVVESAELTAAQDQILLLGRKTAKERLATFLMQLSERASRRGGGGVLALPMTRADIADYLGLTTETVSRTIGRFKSDGLIRLLPNNRVELTRRDLLDQYRISG